MFNCVPDSYIFITLSVQFSGNQNPRGKKGTVITLYIMINQYLVKELHRTSIFVSFQRTSAIVWLCYLYLLAFFFQQLSFKL